MCRNGYYQTATVGCCLLIIGKFKGKTTKAIGDFRDKIVLAKNTFPK
jgi:hypothetical protein